jgi:hypothetical protein
MKKNRRMIASVLCVVSIAASSVAALSIKGVREGASVNSEKNLIEAIFFETRTICVGRFLIDIPKYADVVYGPAAIPASITRYAKAGHKIEEYVGNRFSELGRERRLAGGRLRESDSMVGKVLDGEREGQKIVFGVSKAAGVFYRIDSYVKVGEDLFHQETQSFSEREKYESEVRELNAVAVRLRARADSEIPTEEGVCIDGGFIRDPKPSWEEALKLGVRLKQLPDVHFSLSVTKKDVLVESDALEPRIRQAEELAARGGQGRWYSRIKTLRRGARAIGKWQGYELLARKPVQPEEGEGHEFAFLSQGEPGNPYLPVLDLDMHTGVGGNQIGKVKPSLTDEEAVALWDKLTNSIRVRPVGPKLTKVKLSEAVTIGSVVLGGRQCPLSGLWECDDGNQNLEVQGGSRQRFAQGITMPNAVLLGRPSLWQRIKGEQPQFATENPTVWKFVQFDASAKMDASPPSSSAEGTAS